MSRDPHKDRLRILGLLSASPPLLASQIAWRLGMPLASVSANLGVLRHPHDLVITRKVYFDAPPMRFGWQVIRPSERYWTVPEKRAALWRICPRKMPPKFHHRRQLARPHTDDMRMMLDDLRGAR